MKFQNLSHAEVYEHASNLAELIAGHSDFAEGPIRLCAVSPGAVPAMYLLSLALWAEFDRPCIFYSQEESLQEKRVLIYIDDVNKTGSLAGIVQDLLRVRPGSGFFCVVPESKHVEFIFPWEASGNGI